MKTDRKQEVKQTHPTWTEILPIALSVIEDQEASGEVHAKASELLERMAQTADQWNSPE